MPDPRLPEEIAQEILASEVTQTDLDDPNEASRVRQNAVATGQQVAQGEEWVSYLLAAFGLNVKGQALDDVVNQYPGFTPRVLASQAQGAVMEFTRLSSVGELVLQPGTIVATNGNVAFAVADPGVTFLAGSLVYPATGQPRGYVVAVTPGTIGNVPAGAINRVVTAVQGDTVTCRNAVDLTNGQPRESDEKLQLRALAFRAAGLTQLPPKGLQAMAEAIPGVRHAVVREYPNLPLVDLIIGDGLGFPGSIVPAQARGGTVPQNGQIDFWFDYPAASDEVTLYVNGSPIPVCWTSLLERGRAWLTEEAATTIWAPGDSWECSGHQVFTGIPKRVQATVEGALRFLGVNMGFRSSGARVRVVLEIPEFVDYDIELVVAEGFDEAEVASRIRDSIFEFHLNLRSGEPLLVFDQYANLHTLDGITNLRLRDRENPLAEMGDVYPLSEAHHVSVLRSAIRINGQGG